MSGIIFDGRIVRDMLAYQAARDRGEAQERQAERQYDLDKARINSLIAVNDELIKTEQEKRKGLVTENERKAAELDEFKETRGDRDAQRAATLAYTNAATQQSLSAAALNNENAAGLRQEREFNKSTEGTRRASLEADVENKREINEGLSLGNAATRAQQREIRDQQASRLARDVEKSMEAGDLRGAMALTDRIGELYGATFDADMPIGMRFDEITRLSGQARQLPIHAATVRALAQATPSAEERVTQTEAVIRGGAVTLDPRVAVTEFDADEQGQIDAIHYRMRKAARAALGKDADEAAIREHISSNPEMQQLLDKTLKSFPELARVLESRPNVKSGDPGLDFAPIGNTGAQVPMVNSIDGSRAPITQDAGKFSEGGTAPAAAVTYGDKYDLLRLATTTNGGSIGLVGAGIEAMLAQLAPTGSTIDEATLARAQRNLPEEAVGARSRAMLFTDSDIAGTGDQAQRGKAIAAGEPISPEAQRRDTQYYGARVQNAAEDRVMRQQYNAPEARERRREIFEQKLLPRALDNAFARMTPETFDEGLFTSTILGTPTTFESWRKGVPGHEKYLRDKSNPTVLDRVQASARVDVPAMLSDPGNAALVAQVIGSSSTDPAEWDAGDAQAIVNMVVKARLNDNEGNLFVDRRYTIGKLTEAAVELGLVNGYVSGDQTRSVGPMEGRRTLRSMLPWAGKAADVVDPERDPKLERGGLNARDRLSIRDTLR